jgi:hypothetical protein
MSSGTGRYFGDVKEAFSVGTWRAWWLMAMYFLCPVAVQMALHPARAIQLQSYLQGLDIPYGEFTSHQLVAGELTALFILASLSLATFLATILLYRKAGFWFRLWPVAGVATGFFGNLGRARWRVSRRCRWRF